MLELQHYSENRNLSFQIQDIDTSIFVGTADGAESVYIPYDVLSWVIGELNALYRKKFNKNLETNPESL